MESNGLCLPQSQPHTESQILKLTYDGLKAVQLILLFISKLLKLFLQSLVEIPHLWWITFNDQEVLFPVVIEPDEQRCKGKHTFLLHISTLTMLNFQIAKWNEEDVC